MSCGRVGPKDKYKMVYGGYEKKVFHPSHILLNGIALSDECKWLFIFQEIAASEAETCAETTSWEEAAANTKI